MNSKRERPLALLCHMNRHCESFYCRNFLVNEMHVRRRRCRHRHVVNIFHCMRRTNFQLDAHQSFGIRLLYSHCDCGHLPSWQQTLSGPVPE